MRTYWILSCQWSTQHSDNVPFLFNIECHCIQYSTYCICCSPKVCLAVYQVYCYCSLWNLIHCKVLNLQPNTECYVHFMNVTISSPSSKLHHLSKILKWTEQANPFDILVCTFYTETTRWRPYKHFRPWSKALYLYLGGLLMNSNLMLYSPLGRGSWGYGGRGVCYLLLALPWDPDAPPPTRTPGACPICYAAHATRTYSIMKAVSFQLYSMFIDLLDMFTWICSIFIECAMLSSI